MQNKMKPSFLTSTLSLVFFIGVVTTFLLVILAVVVAIFAPGAYTILSGEKTLVAVVLTAYLGLVSNIAGAYLGSRLPGKQEAPFTTSTTVTASTTTPESPTPTATEEESITTV